MAKDFRGEPATLALQAFNQSDFQLCLKHLSDLESALPNNKKVQHNKALAEFMLNNLKNVEKFRKTLNHITGQTYPELKLSNINASASYYNFAILLYHARYYFQCYTLLERLMTMHKSIKDPKLSKRIILLLMETNMCRRTAQNTIDLANTYKDLFKNDEEIKDLFERLVCRAELMVGQKVSANLKPDTIENLFIIAHQQYLFGDSQEAVNTLGKYKNLKFDYSLLSQGEDIWAAINNNLGVIYLSIKKPFLATKYFQNAIKEHLKTLEHKDKDRLITRRERHLYVHNLGLSLLAANKPETAFEPLLEAARHYPNNPKIWLRIADCCVRHTCGDPLNYVVKKLGSGPHMKLSLGKATKEKYSTTGESFAIPSLSLEFAALCLRNAIYLLQPSENNPEQPLLQAPPGPPLNLVQQNEVKCDALILNSFVLLQMQDPIAALANVKEILQLPDVSHSHKALAHIYAAEALIVLDRISEAIEHLNPPMIHEIVSVLPTQMQDVIGVSVWAKAAVCHILRGDLVAARKILMRINSPRVLPLQIYLEMCTGNIENCHTIIRKSKFMNLLSK